MDHDLINVTPSTDESHHLLRVRGVEESMLRQRDVLLDIRESAAQDRPERWGQASWEVEWTADGDAHLGSARFVDFGVGAPEDQTSRWPRNILLGQQPDRGPARELRYTSRKTLLDSDSWRV